MGTCSISPSTQQKINKMIARYLGTLDTYFLYLEKAQGYKQDAETMNKLRSTNRKITTLLANLAIMRD